MASKTTAYANSAIRVFWLNDGNRTHTQSATNFRPTIRLRSTYIRGVYWNRTNVKGFADLHLATRTTHLIVVSVGLEPTL